MASRYVPCRDLAHVLEMYDAGLLHVRWHVGWVHSGTVPYAWHGLEHISRWYGKSNFPERDWAVLVEEDEE